MFESETIRPIAADVKFTPPRPIDFLVVGVTAAVAAALYGYVLDVWRALPMMVVAAYMFTRWWSARSDRSE